MIIPNLPGFDGQVIRYDPPPPQVPVSATPRIYYVNGIRTTPDVHAKTAVLMAQITNRSVYGVYNQTDGMALDLVQCLKDWGSNVTGKLVEYGSVAYKEVRKVTHFGPAADPMTRFHALPAGERVRRVEAWIAGHNAATLSLYRELRNNAGRPVFVIAHSQGNLITSDALWGMVFSDGEESLNQTEVYSLASPSPAWPLGIRRHRKVYGFKNDLVTLFDPHNWTVLTSWFALGVFNRTAGHWERYGDGFVKQAVPGIDPHDLERNAELLNFANSIRKTLALPAFDVPAAREAERKNVGTW